MTPEERLDRIESIHAEMIEMSRQDRAAYIAWKRDMESQVQSTWLAIERNERSVKEWAEENKEGMGSMEAGDGREGDQD